VLPLAVIAPVAGAVLAPLLARLSSRLALAVAVLASAAAGVILALSGQTGPLYLGGRGPVLGIEYRADRFGLTVALAASVVGTLALLATLSGMHELGRRELGGYACLSLLLIAAVIASALTADLLHLFVWFEVAGLSSYALTGFFLERPHALEATFKLIVLTSVAGFLVFIGTALLYQAHAVVNLPRLASVFPHRATVLDAAAVGIPDRHYGPEILACVIRRAGAACSEEEIRAFCVEHLGPFKAPKEIRFVEELPRGPSGKVQRLKLLDASTSTA